MRGAYKLFKRIGPVSTEQAKDSALALVLLSLLLAMMVKEKTFLWSATIILVLAMGAPVVFKPFAVLWFGLSRLLGEVVSRILLSVIFMLIITPIGLMRRLFGEDPLRERFDRKHVHSFFIDRNKLFEIDDLRNPY